MHYKPMEKKQKSAAQKLASLGGKALVAKKGNAYMKKLAKKGAEARWGKKKSK